VKRLILIAAIAVASGRAAAVDFTDRDWRWVAPGAPAQRFPDTFRALDLNVDFILTHDEARANPLVAAYFDAGDLDGDGRLSPLEFNNVALGLAYPSA
jgi:hypothetical protein